MLAEVLIDKLLELELTTVDVLALLERSGTCHLIGTATGVGVLGQAAAGAVVALLNDVKLT